MFAITRFRHIKVLFHISYSYWSKENRSFFRGLCNIEVRYIEILWRDLMSKHENFMPCSYLVCVIYNRTLEHLKSHVLDPLFSGRDIFTQVGLWRSLCALWWSQKLKIVKAWKHIIKYLIDKLNKFDRNWWEMFKISPWSWNEPQK